MTKELISVEEFEKLQNQIENDFVSANASMAGIRKVFQIITCIMEEKQI